MRHPAENLIHQSRHRGSASTERATRERGVGSYRVFEQVDERVDLQKQNSRRPSPFITIRSVLVVVRASEKEEHIG